MIKYKFDFFLNFYFLVKIDFTKASVNVMEDIFEQLESL
jgi:hypothetical protein